MDGGKTAAIQSLKATAVGNDECAVEATVADAPATAVYSLPAANPILKTTGGGWNRG